MWFRRLLVALVPGRSARIALQIVGLTAVVLASAAVHAQEKRIAPPDEPGPYNVGVRTFAATMTGGRVTRVQVFYPAPELVDESFRYTIITPAGVYRLDSPLGALEDAAPAQGRFPLVVHDHGGAGQGADFHRVAQLSLHETMASHGFVTVVALHSSDPFIRVRDLSLVVDAMLDSTNGFADSIDPRRIGISGYSAGGGAALGAVGGLAANGLVADSRIKAMVLFEPSILSLDDARTISVPYLVMGGAQHRGGLGVPTLFDATVDATPRIYVLTPSATHFNYLTDMGAEIDQTREAALLADPSLPEPLTTRTATSAAAARAYDLWNQGEILFPTLGPGAGSGRNFCDRVGVNSGLDRNGDGFTDSPPFMADDPLLFERAIPEEMMVPLIKLYTVAFWKKYLEGDGHYARYLTPGYAKRNDLEGVVFESE